MRYPQTSFRYDRRANAGFAVVAVALLVVGGAAALYLQSVDHPTRTVAPAEPAAAEAARVADTLSALGQGFLDAAVAEGFGGDGLVPLTRTLWARMNDSVASLYPRLGTSGLAVNVTIAGLSVTTELGRVVAPSVFGGNTPEDLPAWLAVHGTADVTLGDGPEASPPRAVAFGARSAAPAALPLELAARAGAELLPGGLAERFAGQAAQHLLPAHNTSAFGAQVAPAAVLAAVRATVLWAFHSSGNTTFDAAASRAAGDDGLLTAAELTGRTRADDEPIDVSAAGEPFPLGEGGAVRLRIANYSDSNVSVTVTRRGFSGQEVGEGLWQAVTLAARGDVSLLVDVQSGGAPARVGPIHIPVAFDARAAYGPLSRELVVSQELAVAIEQQARTCGVACDVGGWLAAAGLSLNGTMNMTAAVEGALMAFAEAQMTAGLPPVEDATAFMRAYVAPRRALNPLAMSVEGPAILDGALAMFTVDGAPSGSSPVVDGQATLARAPEGQHSVGVSVGCGEAACAGGVVADLPAGHEPVGVMVAPAPAHPFLSEVTRLAFEEDTTLGAAALAAAQDLLGSRPDSDDPRTQLAAALTRAEALLAGGVSPDSFRDAIEDARGFLKVSALVLKAADAARKAAGGTAAPLAQAAGNAATLVLAPETRLLLVATIHGTEILRAAFSNGSIEVASPWTEDGGALTLDFRLEQVGLVATAALAGLTLGADVVRVQRESAEGDGFGVAIATGKFAAHAADTLRELTQGLMRVADRFLATATAEAAAASFAKASVILGAVFLTLELADLYHEAGGDLALMAEGLLHPASVAGMATLPSLAQAAASTAAGALLLMSGQALAAAGPIGIAAGLFVLAGVILLNGRTFASAAFGALNPQERAAFQSAMANRTRDLGHVLAFANGLDPAASADAARATSLVAARLAGSREEAIETALALSARAAVERGLRHAAIAAMEQMDDFASGNHTKDPGRATEGYGQLEKVDANQGGWGTFPYGGDLVVQDTSVPPTKTLSRPEWRASLPVLVAADLTHIHFGYRLTATDGIPVREAERFAGACAAAGELLGELLDEYRALSP